jgi:hypothetical protein
MPLFMRSVTGFPPQWPGFEPRSGQVELVANKVALEHVVYKYFSFTYQFSFHQLFHNHHHHHQPGLVQYVKEWPMRLLLADFNPEDR